MPLDDVVDLLDRWRTSTGGVRRSRVLLDGVRLFAGLSPEERRVVARSLTEAGAPGLADAVAAQTGADVRPDRIQDVTDRLLDLDRQQLDDLIGSLSDPQERARLAREVADRAIADPTADASHAGPPAPSGAPLGGPGLPDRMRLRQQDLDALPPPSDAVEEVGPVATPGSTRDLSGIAGLHAIALGEIPLDDPVLGDLALDHPGLGEVSLGSTDLHDIGVHDISLHEVGLAAGAGVAGAGVAGAGGAGAGVAAAGTAEPPASDAPASETTVEPPARELLVETPAGEPPVEPPASDPDRAPGPDDLADDEGEVPRSDAADPARAASATQLVAELTAASTAPQRFACLRDHRLEHLAADTSLALLDAVPAGWQRRRVATRLVASGSLPTSDLAGVFDRFPARVDTVFLAGALVDAGLVGPDALADLLPPQDVRRLATRRER